MFAGGVWPWTVDVFGHGDWRGLCQCLSIGCQSVPIGILMALTDVWRGRLVIGTWSVWRWIGGFVKDCLRIGRLAVNWRIGNGFSAVDTGLTLGWHGLTGLMGYIKEGEQVFVSKNLPVNWPKIGT